MRRWAELNASEWNTLIVGRACSDVLSGKDTEPDGDAPLGDDLVGWSLDDGVFQPGLDRT